MVISILTIGGVYAKAQIDDFVKQKDAQKEEVQIEKVMNGKYGTVVKKDATENEQLFNQELSEFEDDSYEYVFDENKNLKSIILLNKDGKSLFGEITDEETAKKNAIAFYQKFSAHYFKGEYDVYVSVSEGTEGKQYNVEFWEKLEEKFYTGNKVSIILTFDGYIDTYITHENIDYDNAEKIDTDTTLREKQAENIAFKEAESITEEIEDSYNNSDKATDEGIISDAELLERGGITDDEEQKNLDINIEDRDTCEVKMYNEIIADKVVWVVKISDVSSNNEYGAMSYEVIVDANTGKVMKSDVTR